MPYNLGSKILIIRYIFEQKILTPYFWECKLYCFIVYFVLFIHCLFSAMLTKLQLLDMNFGKIKQGCKQTKSVDQFIKLA